jgi:hypothetical protein
MLLELQQGVMAEEAAEGASHHPFHASKHGGHVVAPVADRADACVPPLVAMPITQAPNPATARACKLCARMDRRKPS